MKQSKKHLNALLCTLFLALVSTAVAQPLVPGKGPVSIDHANFAQLKQKNPNATVTQMLNALLSTGVPILDTRNNITKPRIQVNAAVTALP